jgi:hypothetical protein
MTLQVSQDRGFEIAIPVRLGPLEVSGAVIHCSAQLLETLAAEAQAGYLKKSWGGVEIGGLLLGKRKEGAITISERLFVECDHEFGPAFELSREDRGKLAELLLRFTPAAGEDIVGWYRTTSKYLSLTEEDIALAEEFFSRPGQLALIIQRGRNQEPVFGLFRNEGDRVWKHAVELTLDKAKTISRPECEAVPQREPLHTSVAVEAEAAPPQVMAPDDKPAVPDPVECAPVEQGATPSAAAASPPDSGAEAQDHTVLYKVRKPASEPRPLQARKSARKTGYLLTAGMVVLVLLWSAFVYMRSRTRDNVRIAMHGSPVDKPISPQPKRAQDSQESFKHSLVPREPKTSDTGGADRSGAKSGPSKTFSPPAGVADQARSWSVLDPSKITLPPNQPAVPSSAVQVPPGSERALSETASTDDSPIAAEPISRPKPLLPRNVWRSLRGEVALTFKAEIDASGQVSAAELVSDEGFSGTHTEEVVQAGLAAARAWTFRPANLGGKNMASEALIEIIFKPEATTGMVRK